MKYVVPRGNAVLAALVTTRSVEDGIPTGTVGTSPFRVQREGKPL